MYDLLFLHDICYAHAPPRYVYTYIAVLLVLVSKLPNLYIICVIIQFSQSSLRITDRCRRIIYMLMVETSELWVFLITVNFSEKGRLKYIWHSIN
jgi:hypothetical protein